MHEVCTGGIQAYTTCKVRGHLHRVSSPLTLGGPQSLLPGLPRKCPYLLSYFVGPTKLFF